jgi:hypothetical protein
MTFPAAFEDVFISRTCYEPICRVTMMLVPRPAPVSICSFPPSFATRARISAIPKPSLLFETIPGSPGSIVCDLEY